MTTPLPTAAAALLDGTDWAALNHAYGPAVNCPDPYSDGSIPDIPDLLVQMLHDDEKVRNNAVSDLSNTAFHQNSFYDVSAVTARCLAAMLDDPRAVADVDFFGRRRTLRATLLAWLGSLADDAAWGEHDTPPYTDPAVDAFRAVRPELYTAVTRYLDDPDPDIREAAHGARIPLLKTPEVARERRTATAEMRRVLTESTDRNRRAAAVLAMVAWRQDTSAYLEDSDPAIRALAALSFACANEPDATAVLLAALKDPAATDSWLTQPLPELPEQPLTETLFKAATERTTSVANLLPAAVAIAPRLEGHVVITADSPGLPRLLSLVFRDGVPEHEHHLTLHQRELIEALAASRLTVAGPLRQSLRGASRDEDPYGFDHVRLREHVERRRAHHRKTT